MKQIRCANFAEVAEATLQQMGGPHVAVSGGSTFAQLFPAWAAAGQLDAVSFYPVDERVAPVAKKDSNWEQARQLLFVPLGRTHDLAHEATSGPAYEALLRRRLGDDLRFDTVFLGMGTDGHTASLFPGTPACEDEEAFVLETRSPRPPHSRVTLGLRVLWAARSLVAVVTGEAKKPMVERLLAGDPALPITRALRGHPAPVLILDRAADPQS